MPIPSGGHSEPRRSRLARGLLRETSMNRAAALRVSLLVSMGIVPAACGGATRSHGDGGESGGGGSFSGAGAPTRAGNGSGAETSGGTGTSVSTGGTLTIAGSGPTTGGSGVTGGTSSGVIGGQFGCTAAHFDPRTGLVSCREGYSHRPQAKACGEDAGGAGPANDGSAGETNQGLGGASDVPVELPRASGFVACGLDNATVCDQFQYGYCDVTSASQTAPTCRSGCVTDSDCDPGSICLCDNPSSPTGGACRPAADCQTDEDCGPGGFCASYERFCGSGGFACITPRDTCVNSSSCSAGETCVYWSSHTGPWSRSCLTGVACGRPFLVQQQARLAPSENSAAWLSGKRLQPRTEHLSRAEREALATHWTRMGQMEHASIAAFARFNLQLLSLGAPPDLVEACTQALADETAHTRLCFELASAYAGRAIGPGPLNVAGSLEASSLVDVVELVLAEGCFGETSAALEALEAAEYAADPVIAAAYARIAADEQRHAELAFRFVRWALERGGNAVAERVRSAIAAPPSEDSSAHEVAVPCLRAALEATTARASAERAVARIGS